MKVREGTVQTKVEVWEMKAREKKSVGLTIIWVTFNTVNYDIIQTYLMMVTVAITIPMSVSIGMSISIGSSIAIRLTVSIRASVSIPVRASVPIHYAYGLVITK